MRLCSGSGLRCCWPKHIIIVKKYELAKGEFLSIIKTGQNYPLAFYYLGKTYWALGNLDWAHQNLEQAMSGRLDTPKIRREKERLEQELTILALKDKLEHFPDETASIMQQIKKLEENLLEI